MNEGELEDESDIKSHSNGASRCASIEDVRRCLLESERIWDQNYCDQLSVLVIPFGKYCGSEIKDVPIRYLDETVSVMPETWFVRRVREFVDAAMWHPMSKAGEQSARACNETFAQLEEEWGSVQRRYR
jgi:uncharacterized protein (DUF3820 family)